MLKKRIGIEAIEEYNCLDSYYKISSTLIIPEGCREIGSYAFRGCIRLKEVVIPKSMERIGDFAFRGCYNATIILKKPKRELKFLGLAAFDGCGYVKEETRS